MHRQLRRHTSRASAVESAPEPAEWDHDSLEPDAAGREAFWGGRAISSNPLVGHAARQWTAGWKLASADLVARSTRDAWTVSAAERRTLLRAFRPADLITASRGRTRSSGTPTD